MAKVTGPLFSLDASGKFADSLVFTKWKGINTVRQYAKPTNVNSAKQKVVRNAFTAASALYQKLLGPDKEAWKLRSAGLPMSGYNAFMGIAVQTLMKMRAFTLINKVQVDNITSNSAQIKITADEDGEANILYGEKPGSYYDSIPISLLKDTEITVSLSDLVASNNYYFRVVQDAVPLNAPENLAITVEGSSGTTVYGYRVTALSKAGETIPCAELTINDGNAVLDETNFNNITWDPVENAVQYSVFRSSSEGDSATTGRIAVIGDTSLEDTGLAAEGDEPNENTAFDHYGESGDYDFVTM
ncbi:MAG: YfhO family protein [Firmicutes bacterium]|nr:YfhO family protein [Bacillota bacterium]